MFRGPPGHCGLWKVDLGSTYSITGSEVTWEKSATNYQYKVEVSTDNANWTLAADKTVNTSADQTQSDGFSAAARYVRITVTGLAANSWASFYEFKVFGDSGPTPTPTPSPRSAFIQIEAESYNNQSGIQTVSCTEGGEGVGYIENRLDSITGPLVG
jgi:hypothetical protein